MTENHVMANTFRNTRQCTCIDDVYYNYNKTYGVTSDEKLTTSERSDLCMGTWIQRILAMHTEYKIVQQIQKSTLGGITIHYKQQHHIDRMHYVANYHLRILPYVIRYHVVIASLPD
jgi:hypothetical protein